LTRTEKLEAQCFLRWSDYRLTRYRRDHLLKRFKQEPRGRAAVENLFSSRLNLFKFEDTKLEEDPPLDEDPHLDEDPLLDEDPITEEGPLLDEDPLTEEDPPRGSGTKGIA
jgi:hypothetical protein